MADAGLPPRPPRPDRARFGSADRVRVRNRFDGAWCTGFEVAEVVDDQGGRGRCYALRRVSDGVVLPARFGEDDLAEGP